MRYTSHLLFLTSCISLGVNSQAIGQHTLPKAEMFFKHGLPEDAKREAIEVIFSSREKNEVAGAKLLLAQAAVKDGRLTHAVELWQDILSAHADSPSAAIAQGLLSQVISLTGSSLDRTVDNAVAQQYFSAADFWLEDLEMPYRVDTSWMPKESAAVYWLDTIIVEFPGSPSAELAMYFKVRAYLGNRGQGQYGSGGFGVLGAITESIGATSSEKLKIQELLNAMMVKAKEALAELEGAFPESRYLPILKFMIADAYWRLNKKEDAAPWLEQVVNSSRTESLWSQLAKLRQTFWHGQ